MGEKGNPAEFWAPPGHEGGMCGAKLRPIFFECADSDHETGSAFNPL